MYVYHFTPRYISADTALLSPQVNHMVVGSVGLNFLFVET